MPIDYQLTNTAQVRTFLEGAEYLGTNASGSLQRRPRDTGLENPAEVWHYSRLANVTKPGEDRYNLIVTVQKEFPDEDSDSGTITGSSLKITQWNRKVAFLATGTMFSSSENSRAKEDPDVANLVKELFDAYETWPKE